MTRANMHGNSRLAVRRRTSVAFGGMLFVRIEQLPCIEVASDALHTLPCATVSAPGKGGRGFEMDLSSAIHGTFEASSEVSHRRPAGTRIGEPRVLSPDALVDPASARRWHDRTGLEDPFAAFCSLSTPGVDQGRGPWPAERCLNGRDDERGSTRAARDDPDADENGPQQKTPTNNAARTPQSHRTSKSASHRRSSRLTRIRGACRSARTALMTPSSPAAGLLRSRPAGVETRSGRSTWRARRGAHRRRGRSAHPREGKESRAPDGSSRRLP